MADGSWGLTIIDVQDPLNPKLVSQTLCNGWAMKVDLNNDETYAYLA